MEYLKKTNISTILLVLLTGRMILSEPSYAVAVFGLGVAGLYAYSQYLKAHEVKPADEELKKEIATLKNAISNVSVKNGLRAPPSEGQRYF